MEKSHRRRSIRLKNYDYAQEGAYFVTICAYQKQCIFGHIDDGEMFLSEYGEIVKEEWEQTSILRDNVELDAFVVMPNHIHGIIVITYNLNAKNNTPNVKSVGAWCIIKPRQFLRYIPKSLPDIIQNFKSVVTKRINNHHPLEYTRVWQRNHDVRIIKNKANLNLLRRYIISNPKRWQQDKLYRDRQIIIIDRIDI
jgi:REP-associated tyrosine transposase